MSHPSLHPEKRFVVGSLSYTRSAIAVLFAWLLWGDFIFSFMSQVMPALLPLLLQNHGATNSEITLIVTSIMMIINAIVNPIISYASDRHRGRWGRRRPFIFWTTPFVALFLGAIPFAPEILHWIISSELGRTIMNHAPLSPVLFVFAILVSGFQIFNMFVSSIYYYLIPDVVPTELLGRFYALFRIFGALAGMAFNYFVFGAAGEYMKEIFVISALLYGIFMMLMCWRVKEGEYPPPIREEHGHWWSGISNYARECFGHSYYWWVFFTYSTVLWGTLSNVFMVFYLRDEVGLSLDLIGKTTMWMSAIFVVFAYPLGVLLDRWGCHKTLVTSMLILAASSLIMFFFALDSSSAIALSILRGLPIGMVTLAMGKWTVEVYPIDRYGQFGSAGALFSSVGGLLFGYACGWWMDWLKEYRYFLIWNAGFSLLGAATALVVFKQWKRYGGGVNYQAP